jgi:phage terminase large subunit
MRIPVQPYVFPQSPNLLALMDCILNCDANEILISGPRDCAKTFTIWHCLLTLHELIPYCQTLIARLEATTLAMLFTQLDTKILKYGLEDTRNPFVFKSGSKSDPRRHILFDNGSKMAFVGLDSGEKVLGGEHDLFWFNECQRELGNHNTEDDWTKVLGGMVDGRAGNWGHGRYCAIGDLNPTHKRHWAYLRAEEKKKMRHFRIKHQDHPLFYDWETETWFEKGLDTRADLQRQHTKGTYEYMRMVEGEFCNAEGAVYSMFDTQRHVQPMQRQDFTESGKWGIPKWRMSVDFGSGSINALGLIAYTPQDRTHRLFKEIYKSEIQVSELIRLSDKMLHDYQVPKSAIEVCYADHQTDCWKQMRDAGYPIKLADKDVVAGVETCKRVIGDGRWIVNSDSLYEPDMKIPIRQYVHEVLGYAYKNDNKKNGSLNDDKPQKGNDHAMDWKRYYLHGEEGNPIELPDMFSVF